MNATGHVFALQFDGDGPSQMLTTAGTVGAVGVAGVAVTPIALDLRYHFQNVSDGRRVENAGADEERGDDTRPDE